MSTVCIKPYRPVNPVTRDPEWGAFSPLLSTLFAGFGGAGTAAAGGHIPLDVEANDESVIVRASLPGFTADDIEATVEDNLLTIKVSAEGLEDSADRRFLFGEQSEGALERSIRLPRNLDVHKAEASSKDGIFKITIPRSEESKPHRIKAAGPQAADG